MDRRGAAAGDSKTPWGVQERHTPLGRRPPGTTRSWRPSEFRLPLRRADRTPQQSSHFFLNVDDDFRFTQFFTEVLVLATQLLVLIAEGTALGLGAALLWSQGMQDSGGAFLPPGHQVRGVQALPPEQGADATGLLFGLIGLSQNPLFVPGRKASALGAGDDFGVGTAGDPLIAGGRAAIKGSPALDRRRPRCVRPRSARPHCALPTGPERMSSYSSCRSEEHTSELQSLRHLV